MLMYKTEPLYTAAGKHACRAFKLALICIFALGFLGNFKALAATTLEISDANPMAMPEVGSYKLRILSLPCWN
ncbi:MAG: hypothetical protein JWN25_3556 [Verrucomicrobiales bacterium]|nr:hypothetical protein [Verrucomicrobiales bacterium]